MSTRTRTRVRHTVETLPAKHCLQIPWRAGKGTYVPSLGGLQRLGWGIPGRSLKGQEGPKSQRLSACLDERFRMFFFSFETSILNKAENTRHPSSRLREDSLACYASWDHSILLFFFLSCTSPPPTPCEPKAVDAPPLLVQSATCLVEILKSRLDRLLQLLVADHKDALLVATDQGHSLVNASIQFV